jgi:hypothetical protein
MKEHELKNMSNIELYLLANSTPYQSIKDRIEQILSKRL